VLEISASPIVADVPPSMAHKAWLNHCLDECASILVLNERLIKETSRQAKGYFIHLASNRSPIVGFGG
jgi:hypothetical protein